jgi:hypothetical protein
MMRENPKFLWIGIAIVLLAAALSYFWPNQSSVVGGQVNIPATGVISQPGSWDTLVLVGGPLIGYVMRYLGLTYVLGRLPLAFLSALIGSTFPLFFMHWPADSAFRFLLPVFQALLIALLIAGIKETS